MRGAENYGRAVFMLAEECGKVEEVFSDLSSVCDALEREPEYTRLLDNPALARCERLSLVDRTLSPVLPEVRDFIKYLSERRAVSTLPAAMAEFSALRDERLGIERVEAVTAVPMSDGQCDALKSRLAALTGKTVIIKNTVDPGILGGMKLRYSGVQLDGSVKTRLDKLEKQLSQIIV